MDSESNTRKQRIDPRLTGAGWSVRPFQHAYLKQRPNASAVEEWPTTAGPADYALCEAGSVLGVVEAKKLTIGPQGVLPQAERYSRAIKGNTTYQGEIPHQMKGRTVEKFGRDALERKVDSYGHRRRGRRSGERPDVADVAVFALDMLREELGDRLKTGLKVVSSGGLRRGGQPDLDDGVAVRIAD
jgi:hypothetical protein